MPGFGAVSPPTSATVNANGLSGAMTGGVTAPNPSPSTPPTQSGGGGLGPNPGWGQPQAGWGQSQTGWGPMSFSSRASFSPPRLTPNASQRDYGKFKGW